jgi:hypothetical protein
MVNAIFGRLLVFLDGVKSWDFRHDAGSYYLGTIMGGTSLLKIGLGFDGAQVQSLCCAENRIQPLSG